MSNSNSERQAAYRQVVQALLECPRNDEQRILTANRDLVDEGLVKALKDKAKMMMRRNDPELGATIQRLVSFAQQLERKLAAAPREIVELAEEDYLRFSLELLQIVVNSQGDGTIVHQFFDGHLAYLNEHLLAIFPPLIAAILEREEDPDRQAYIRSTLHSLSVDLQDYPSGDRSVNIALSIACRDRPLGAISEPNELIDRSNEDRQNAYSELVKALIQCPLNDEERVLSTHPELVDKGLVIALLEVAEIRKKRHSPDSASTIEWLESFAEQLSQKLELELDIDRQTDDEFQEVANDREEEEIEYQFTDNNDNMEIEPVDRILTVVNSTSIAIDALKESLALGQIYFNQGSWQLAADTYEIAMQAVETSHNWVVDEQQQQEMRKDALTIYENAIECAINLENYPQAIEYVERIRNLDSAIAGQIQVETIDYADIQKLIHSPHAAILTCYTTNDDTHIFIIKQSGAPTIHTCKNQGKQKFQKWLQRTWINPSHEDTTNWVKDLPRLLHDISQRLELDPLIATHLTDINELILFPHLNLHQIPFAALPITPLQGRGEFLRDRFIIRSIPSSQILEYYQLRPPVTTADIGTIEDADDSLLGARSVQSTLWEVDEYASVIFNFMYHQERHKGTNRAISLHTAQSQLRNLTGTEFQRDYYPHAIEYATKHHPTLKTALEQHLKAYSELDKPFESPFYWAAFITQGMA
jgi:CHAT domain-containing protein